MVKGAYLGVRVEFDLTSTHDRLTVQEVTKRSFTAETRRVETFSDNWKLVLQIRSGENGRNMKNYYFVSGTMDVRFLFRFNCVVAVGSHCF